MRFVEVDKNIKYGTYVVNATKGSNDDDFNDNDEIKEDEDDGSIHVVNLTETMNLHKVVGSNEFA